MIAQDLRDAVGTALSTVRDPELDESIVDLGFVTATTVVDGRAEVRLRLPTYFCAPNFAYLMVADAYDATMAVEGVDQVSVVLEEHFAAAEINAGVAAGAGFVGSFPGEAGAELHELRRTFQRKAHTACLERACERLLKAGWTIEGLSGAHLADLPDSPERASLLRRRADIGLSVAADSPVLVDDDGEPVLADQIPFRLRFARTVRVSLDGNAHFCRGLLTTRYPHAAADQRPRHAAQEASA
ncbi:metal-sulfur cluster biosynthetic enzyme [Actinoplanes sp. ATCC 53533]|uniref:iron-sulfur cluster assembly protein n=1 Tax=Actinoplanes sp. ATCC 53533 TaxID=1288362 RepID=UPI000F77B332|nr:iron-sulfur cluster assembly protein [Actinoplanes sp. ATCC 53533]RSM55869.1 metal-sulfur cluster biosynthetic enzyme [Actinoplanes sp. ATCC 53533]